MSLPTLYEHYTTGGVTAGLSAAQPYFTLNNKNISIYSGAMHYFRVPQEYWRDRLRKMRAAGLNAVETYVPWNLHEPQPGNFDFGDGGTDFQQLLDIEKFLKTAQEEDLLAIVRPGPYICAEWEFGGLPSWLLSEKDIKVRSSDERFMGYVEKYFKALLSILTLLQFTKGGPIIAFQIENEYGSLTTHDMPYLEGLKNILQNNGVVELLFTADGPSIGNYGQIPGVLYTANFNNNPENNLNIMQTYQPGAPSMVMEYWSGWFDHWTETHQTVTNLYFTDTLRAILKYPASVNFYMFHGGTSFGFTNGGNLADGSTDNKGFQPDTTSYDYDCPLNENGDYTDKYESVVKSLAEYNPIKTSLPERPSLTPRTAYKSLSIIQQLRLNDVIAQSKVRFESENVIPMERFPINNNAGQSYGYAVYRKKNINIWPKSVLKINGRVCDSVMVLINGELKSKVLQTQQDLKGFGYWKQKDSSLTLPDVGYRNATLDLVVENWGRVGFGSLSQFVQHKGLWQGNVTLNDEFLLDWEIIPLEFKKNWTNSLVNWEFPTFQEGPAIYKSVLRIEGTPKDTYIDMRSWNKGFIIVNGFVLSRHLHLGPQQAAYLPAPFLKKGDNEILIFEHFKPANSVQFSDDQIFQTKKTMFDYVDELLDYVDDLIVSYGYSPVFNEEE